MLHATETAQRQQVFAPSHIRVVRPDEAVAYGRATGDQSPLYEAGVCIPPLLATEITWPCVREATAGLIPPGGATSTVHWAQDSHYARMPSAGEPLGSTAHLVARRGGRVGGLLRFRVETRDAQGSLVIEQFVSLFVRAGVREGRLGVAPPSHSFSAQACEPLPPLNVDVPADQARVYAVSVDDCNPIHSDEYSARQAGFDGVIIHGVCTLALCTRALLEAVAESDPRRVRRVSGCFSNPVYPGSQVVVQPYLLPSSGDRTLCGFTASSNDSVVVRSGRLELEGS